MSVSGIIIIWKDQYRGECGRTIRRELLLFLKERDFTADIKPLMLTSEVRMFHIQGT